MAVILETSLGDITVDLYTNERPRCCLNFLKLCKMKYYNFCLFHSVQRGLVAQTGDPTGSGKGGESMFTKLYGDQAKYFEKEVKPRIKHTKTGMLSMANNGADMHGSQFFLTLAPDIDYLDGKHTVFGEVSEGLEVLSKFNEAYVDEEGRPYQDIRVFHTVVLDDPYDDPDGLEDHIPDRSPQPTKEQLQSGRLGVDEKIDDMEGLTSEEVEEKMAAKQAQANAQILEMVGDLPEADVKPLDNVLFVCKLNPVTTDDDLNIIFSRFGHIKSCEVIKDQKTGESLQYAFIEFDKEADCEAAYFKMDNVLIDERRIHVDFSQSVSKFKWKGKGKGVEKLTDHKPDRYTLKDHSKKDDRYDLVFDDDTAHAPSSKHKKKKMKSERREANDTSHRSTQGERIHRRDSRSRSPHRRHKRYKDSEDGERRRHKERQHHRHRH